VKGKSFITGSLKKKMGHGSRDWVELLQKRRNDYQRLGRCLFGAKSASLGEIKEERKDGGQMLEIKTSAFHLHHRKLRKGTPSPSLTKH